VLLHCKALVAGVVIVHGKLLFLSFFWSRYTFGVRSRGG